MTPTVLLTGATGYVGGELLGELLRRGHEVRCLVRRPGASPLPVEVEVAAGDVLDPRSLAAALDGVDVAMYLVHSMGRGADRSGFAARDREGALNFGAAARRAGVRRIVYLGGLEGAETAESEHLRSREEVARILGSQVDDTVHVRAAMVIGSGSTSFLMLRHLVERLPVMIGPRWIDTRTQPIAIRDVVGTLATVAAPELQPPAEVQIGGADVLTYRAMMDRFATLVGRRPPLIVRVPVLTPRLSSYWVGFVTPIEPALARPLVQGLSAETVVRTPPPAGLNDRPLGFEEAVGIALAEA